MNMAITAQWYPVCPAEAIDPFLGVCAKLGEHQIALFKLADGSLFAIENHDPFSAANVLSRGIVGDKQGVPVVASPIYKHHFNLATGECLEDPDVRLLTFPLRVNQGIVEIAQP